jgi:hypothetical protein
MLSKKHKSIKYVGTQGGESIKLQKLEHSIDLRIWWHGYAEDIDTLAENGER